MWACCCPPSASAIGTCDTRCFPYAALVLRDSDRLSSAALSGVVASHPRLEPVAGVVEGFRSTLLGTPPSDAGLVLTSSTVVVLALAGGLAFFSHVERTMADEI